MNIFNRFVKHLFSTHAAGKRAFPPASLKAIETAIADGEKLHCAEVRLIVEHSLSACAVFHRMTSRQRAIELFSQYKMWDTEENCGVLLYVNLADRKVEIIADRAVTKLISDKEWHAVCRTMTDGFARGEFHNSTTAALTQLNALLQSYFPASGEHPNQLPNKPIVV